jgi:hypothetical protein
VTAAPALGMEQGPWERNIAQSVKFSALYRSRRFTVIFITTRLWTLSGTRWISFTVIMIYFNIIPHQSLGASSMIARLSHTCCMPVNLILFDFIIWRRVQIMIKLLIMNFVHCPVLSSLGPNSPLTNIL